MTAIHLHDLGPDELRAIIREEVQAVLGAVPDTRPLLSTADVAKRLGFKSAAVARNLIESGKLDAIRVGDAWRVRESALARFQSGEELTAGSGGLSPMTTPLSPASTVTLPARRGAA